MVQADVDNNGITIGASALTLNGGTIRLAGSSTVDAMLGLGSHAITDSTNHKVNGAALTAAAVSGAAITNAPNSGDTYRLGESIQITVTFNRAVNVVTTGGTPQVALDLTSGTRQADYASGSGTRSLVFDYLLVAGDFDEDGIGVAAGALTLNSGAINDARDATVAASLGLGTHAIAGGTGYRVATPPFVLATNGITVNSPGAGSSTYERGERIEVTVHFNRAVDVTGTPQVALDLTSGTRQADYVSGTGTASLLFRYTVALGDEDADGISIATNALTLNGGTIRASTADRIAAGLGLGTNAVTNDSTRLVDGMQFTAAAVSGVSIASMPTSSATYGLGERIAVQVTFTQRVDVTGTPQVELTVGAVPRQADYASGSGTNSLTFHYIVQGWMSGGSGSDMVDADTDGIAIPANALTLNGGAIDDARDTTEAATLTHGAVAASASHKVDGSPLSIRPVPFVVAGVTVESAPPAGGSYRAGDEIRVRVTFDRAVEVTGTPTLALMIGSETLQASYESGSGTPELVFRYVVRPGDTARTRFIVPVGRLSGTFRLVGRIGGEASDPRAEVRNPSLGITEPVEGDPVDGGPASPPLPSLTIDAPQVTEGVAGTTSTLRFTVTMSRTSARPVTVAWEDTGSGTATAGAADAPGADYVALVPGTLTFAPGTRQQTIDVTVIGDVEDEPAETVVVRLRSAVNATLSISVGVGTITDGMNVAPDQMPSFGDASLPVQRYVQDVEIAPLTLPAATGGDLPLTYTLAGPGPSGALPEGLSYTPPADAATGGTLAGTPAVAVEEAVWTLTATDADGDTATLAFTVEVEAADLKPTFGDARVSAQRYIQSTAIAPLVLPAATDGDLPLTYTLTGPGPSGALPEGLTYTPPADAATGGTLAGTPAVPAEEAVWTLTVTDVDGDTATLTFTVEVEADLAPTFGSARVSAQRYMQDVEIAPLALPAATGGNGALTYTLTPVLPEGLAYTPPGDAGGGVLAGTPAVPVAPAAWTLAAADADGDTATLTFTVEVVDRLRERLKGVNEAILADLSRAMTASTVDAVSGRIGQALAPDGAASGAMGSAEEMASAFAGLLRSNEEALGEGAWSWRRGLDGRRFALALSGTGGEGAGAVSVWGAGDYRPLSGRESGVDWDGHLFGAHVGMDARFGTGGLAGLALSVSEGRLDYTDTSALALGKAVEGKYESRMTSAHPYLGWAWGRGTHAWASLGYGQGTIEIDDGEAGRQTSGSTLRSAAAGGSVRVFSGRGSEGLRPGGGGPEGGGVDDAAGKWRTTTSVSRGCRSGRTGRGYRRRGRGRSRWAVARRSRRRWSWGCASTGARARTVRGWSLGEGWTTRTRPWV